MTISARPKQAEHAARPATLTVHGQSPLFPQLPFDMHARADAAVKDEQLQAFVQRATLLKDQARTKACIDTFGDRHPALRELAGQIKQHTLDHLDHYIERFIDTATAAGAQVHLAADAEQANAICLRLARENGVKVCVKSKSMVTEETHLLPQLQAIGVETIETDLGEFILQLDHDAPSHIVTPMIHKDRTAVARAFQRELGAEYTEDAQQLTKIARAYLRDKFRQADMGISGGNFLVAETGSVVICTNEGNGRLTTSVPRIHVAMVGIEKLVPTYDHLAVLLKLLARHSTAQPLTCYTHIMTGPRRGPRHDNPEHDGPEQMHIILLDNGRTEILKAETREMLRCIRCGACLNACPVYRQVGGHSYGAVYPGPIGALITPLFRGLANYKDLPHASSLCGACFEACPVKIDIPRYLIQLRRDMVGGCITGWRERLTFRLWAMTLRHGALYRLTGWMQMRMFRLLGRGQSGQDPYSRRGWITHMGGPLKGWTSQRDMPTPPAHSFRHWWRNRDDGADSDGGGHA